MNAEYKYLIRFDRIIIIRKSDGKPIGQWKPKDDLSEAMDEEKHRHNDSPNNGFIKTQIEYNGTES